MRMCGADRNALPRHHLIPIMCFGTDCAPQYTNIEEEHCVMPHDTSRGRVALVLDVEPLAEDVAAWCAAPPPPVLPGVTMLQWSREARHR